MKNVVAVLKLTAKGKFRLPNFIMSDTAARIIHVETRDGDFAHLEYIDFLYALRAPSEALQLRRAFANDDLL